MFPLTPQYLLLSRHPTDTASALAKPGHFVFGYHRGLRFARKDR